MRNQNQSERNLEQLSGSELSRVAGGAYGVDDFRLGFYELETLEHLIWTNGSFRPVSWGEIAGSGKQVYIDGMLIDTEGMLGPMP